MRLVPVAARCPACESEDVIYSCSPHCCFNHVCGACRTSWQLGTVTAGRQLPAVEPSPGDYDTSYPTAPCAACGGLVFQIEASDELYCPHCRAALRLAYSAVQSWSS